ncbi:MAG: hypothetical protein AAGA30_09390 [Planctomycetota bacterium]
MLSYESRFTQFMGLCEVNHWTLKQYFIVGPNQQLKEKSLDLARQFLQQQPLWPQDLQSGYGFMTLHFGEEANWLLLDLWADDILRHFLFMAAHESPDHFVPGPDNGTMACVWEMAILQHERDAWVKYRMTNPDAPDFHGYLQDVLEIKIEDKKD